MLVDMPERSIHKCAKSERAARKKQNKKLSRGRNLHVSRRFVFLSCCPPVELESPLPRLTHSLSPSLPSSPPSLPSPAPPRPSLPPSLPLPPPPLSVGSPFTPSGGTASAGLDCREGGASRQVWGVFCFPSKVFRQDARGLVSYT